jgi:tetratricopeptide (TPR) repeat protein
MATREEITTLVSYVLGEKNRQLLIGSGLDTLSKDCRIAALRGLQDLGWIGHSGLADFSESYSLTKEGRRTAAECPSVTELESCTQNHIDALRSVDNETNCAQKEGLRKLVSIDCDMGNWDTALIHCYQLRKLADKTRDTEAAAFALLHEGKVGMVQNRWDDALEAYLNASEKYMEAGDRKGVAMTNRAMGVIYANKGDHSSAMRCFESSLSMARMIGDKDLEARAEGNLANLYDLEGRFQEAEKAYERCLSFFVESGDLICTAKTSNNLGVLNLMKENYQVAGEYFEKTIGACRRIKNKEVLGIALVNCGYCHAKCGNLSGSVSLTDEAVAILKEQNDRNLLALAYRNYGSIEMRNGKFDAAFDWFEKSVRVAEASGVEDTMAACCYEYGMSLINAVTDVRLAKRLLKRSASIFRGIGNIDKARSIEKKLAAA